MSLPDLSIDEWAGRLAGVLGSLVSAGLLQGTLKQRLFTMVGGALCSYYFAPWVAEKLGMPDAFTGFLVGMFAMAIASRMWEWVQTAPIAAFWQIVLDWLRRITGTGTTK